MKVLFLVADGMGDWPLDELGGKTPLGAAHTPVMDSMAATGLLGTCRTVPPGMPPGSDVANMALLGYDPALYHTGRGPIEAAAQGLNLDADDLVFRLNLVTVEGLGDGGIMRDYSARHIPTEVSAPLVAGLQEAFGDDDFAFYPGVQYRHLLVMKGAGSAPEATLPVEPPHDITDKPMAASVAAFKQSPKLWELVQKASAHLADDPANASKANAIWPWGQGKRLSLPAFQQQAGLSGAVVSAVDLVKGLGRAADMEVLEVPGATGLLDTNYEGKVEAALDFLNRGGEYVYVHLEGPDECGHGGDIEGKVESLARFDSRIVKPLKDAMAGQDALFVVTCDHLTPIALKTHHADPVPFMVWKESLQLGSNYDFTEDVCSEGPTIEPGHGLLRHLLSLVSSPS